MVKLIISARALGIGCHLTNGWVLWTFESKHLQYSSWVSNTMMQLSDILEAWGGGEGSQSKYLVVIICLKTRALRANSFIGLEVLR